jgi:hypothetical protein
MKSIPLPPDGAHATRDREDARTLWSALLPTWTDPSASRVRNLRRLVQALRNPRAVATVADTLEHRAAHPHLRGVAQ